MINNRDDAGKLVVQVVMKNVAKVKRNIAVPVRLPDT